MKKKTGSTHVTKAGGNVFLDLGFSPKEAAELKAQSKAAIAVKLAAKEQMMTEIAGWMAEQHLKQVEAAAILGVTRPRVSDVVRKQSSKFTIDALFDMLIKTGKNVRVSVGG